MTKRTLASVLMGLALISASVVAVADEDEHTGHEAGHDSPFAGMPVLALMHNMQYYGHKLGLSIDAGNSELMGFYIHELEEVIEAVSEIERYDGVPIADLLESSLKPAFEDLETAIEAGSLERIDAGYNALLDGCNACHRGAQRPYIVIQRSSENPYPQRFAPVD